MSVANAGSSLPFCWIIKRGVRTLKQTSRLSELRDVLGAPTTLGDDDNRTFEEQMEDIGVEVERVKVIKPDGVVKPETIWYRGQRKSFRGLKNKISLNNGGVGIGSKIAEVLGGKGARVNIGIYKKGTEKMIAIQKSETGRLSIRQTENNSFRLSSRSLSRWLQSQGMPLGKYLVMEAKGGLLAKPVK